MTFIHFLNCCALTFGPSVIVYKASKLGEFGALSVCIWGAIAYVVTQLAKMIFLATFIPLSESQTFDVFQELVKSGINLMDAVGVYFIMNRNINISGSFGDKDVKILGIGLGWSTSESLLMRVAPLWIGARHLEFDPLYLQSSIEANINLLLNISFVSVVWIWSLLWNRNKLEPKIFIVLVAVLGVFFTLPAVLSYLRLQFDAWTVLFFYGCVTVSLYVFSKLLHAFIAKK